MSGGQIPKEVQETARQMGAETVVYFDGKGNISIQTDQGREISIKRPKKKRSRGPAKTNW